MKALFTGVRLRRSCLWLLLGMCLSFLSPLSTAPAWAEPPAQWTLNFRDADIQDLVHFVAEATGRTLVIDPQLRGRVQVISSQPVNAQQLYQLFLSVLEVNGFTAVGTGELVRIVPLKDARTGAGAGTGTGTEPAGAAVTTRVIPLRNVAAATLIPVLRPLAPPEAHLVAYPPSNAVIIADSGDNIARIKEIIRQIDVAAVEETEMLRLNYAIAEDLAEMLKQLHRQEGQPQGERRPPGILADKRSNSLLVSGDEMQRERIRSLVRRLDVPRSRDSNVRVVYLRYAKAKALAEVLGRVVNQFEPGEEAAFGRVARRAGIEADEGTNSLILTGDEALIESMLVVVERLDIRRAQVLVEAIIVEMNYRAGRDLGVQWLFLDNNGAFGSSSRGGEGNLGGAIGGAVLDGNRSNLLGVLGGTEGQVLGMSRLDRNFSFQVVLNALQRDTDANILSTPSLLTLDNEEALIVVGQNVPFLTGSYTTTGGGSSTPQNPFQTIQRENVGISLKVTPHINEGDSLVLDIVQEVSSLTGVASEINASDVITNERRIETKVLADNGQTIVLGGLIQDDIQESVQKVPVLGDIPGVGRLFRSNATSKSKTQLMVFLRATIIRDERVLAGATGDKYEYIREQQLQRRSRGGHFVGAEEWPLLPEWQEQLRYLERLRQEVTADNAGVPLHGH